MWEWAGYDQNGVSQFYVHDKETGERTGETTNTPEEKDRTIVGNAQPWLTMGWNNNLTYKNWDFNAFFTGVFGQKIFNEPRAFFSNIANVTEGQECNEIHRIGTESNRFILLASVRPLS